MASADFQIAWQPDAKEDLDRAIEAINRHTDALERFMARDPAQDVLHAIEFATAKIEPGDTLIINIRDSLPEDVLERMLKQMGEALEKRIGSRCIVMNCKNGIDLAAVKR